LLQIFDYVKVSAPSNSGLQARVQEILCGNGKPATYEHVCAVAETAAQLAGAPDYFDVTLRAIRAMCEVTGAPVYDADGMMQSGTLVRHLILPLRTAESIHILDAIAAELPKGTPVSLMRQYTPMNGVHIPGLDRRLTAREYHRVRDHMMDLGLDGYLQQKEAADSAYTPAFMDEESIRLFPDDE